jgi:glycerol-3-phosphate dehydrogenase
MSKLTRRSFGKLAAGTGAGVVAGPMLAPFAIAQGAAKVVVVGGGAGGATVAHFVKIAAPNLDVTLIEANPIYSSSFFSNLYLGGIRTLESVS